MARKKGAGRKAGRAQQELFRGQCNCSYWHGVFGGLYLGHLRSAIYEHLIKAETLADSVLHKKRVWLDVERLDFDCDGREEILVSTPQVGACLDTNGGMMTEWDYRPGAVNLINTLSRRPEAYHRNIVSPSEPRRPSEGKIRSIHDITSTKVKGLEKMLVYDPYRRGTFIDHFLEEKTTLQQFFLGRYTELGDFAGRFYSLHKIERPKPTQATVHFQRKGKVGRRSVTLIKSIRMHARRPELEVTYTIANPGRKEMAVVFGSECNFSLWNSKLSKRARLFRKLSHFDLEGEAEGLRIRFQFSQETKMWTFPVHTISQSESGFEKTYQGVSLFPHWRMTIGPGEERRIGFMLAIEKVSA